MKRLLISHPGNEAITESLALATGSQFEALETRQFPDGESYVRLPQLVANRHVGFVCTLDRPDEKFLRLVYACAAARDQNAASVGVIAPYLAYMRQDRAFHAGEAVTARYFAKAFSPWIDWLVTIDPHLHRIHELSEVYSVRTTVGHAAPAVARWIADNVSNPVLIGPDEESAQWVRDIAGRANSPFVALTKKRLGDRNVQVSIPDLEKLRDKTPVIVDDIISTGRSMLQTISGIKQVFDRKPFCIGVHAVFAGDAYQLLASAGIEQIVTCNTIEHRSNQIDITGVLADQLRQIQLSS